MRRLFKIALGVLLLSFTFFCPNIYSSDTANGNNTTNCVIIDTDMGSDDCIAILYLLQKCPYDIKAITVAGTSFCFPGAGVRNVLDLQSFGWPWNIPVAAGQTEGIDGSRNAHFMKYSLRKDFSDLFKVKLPYNPTIPGGVKAEDLLADKILNSKTKATILSIGGLTNIARALQKNDNIKNKISMIYIMGGGINVPGNLQYFNDKLNTTAEWNIFADPAAAEFVFKSGVPVTLVPLDVCQEVPVDEKYFDKISANIQSPQTEFVYNILKASAGTDIKENNYLLWDPLAAVIMMNELMGKFKTEKLSVITEPGDNYGRTVVDNNNGNDIRVLISVDSEKVKNELLEVLNY